MPISVVCPGCLKRFQVSEKFAGMKGPCPNCNTLIDIPKEKIVIRGAEEFSSGGKNAQGELVLKPIARIDTKITQKEIIIAVAGTIGTLLLAMIIGYELPFGSNRTLLNMIGALGVLLVSFPISMFGYRILRDSEDIDILEGIELYKRAALCGVIYAILWVVFELSSNYLHANTAYHYLFISIVPFIVLCTIAAHVIFDLDTFRSVFHYLFFLAAVIVLRGLIGLGWIWVLVTSANPGRGAPPIPGL